jgi:hypothetical protein
MPPAASARVLARSRRLLLPKPTEGVRKIVHEVVCLDNPLVRPMPNCGVGLWREIEHLVQRLGDVLTGQDIDKKSRDTWLDLINESTGGRGHNDWPLFARPQRDFERDIGEGFVSGRDHHYFCPSPLAQGTG